MGEIQKYDGAVEIIKRAILQSQYSAAKAVNKTQLMLYYGIGKYISLNSRRGYWGKGAIDAISDRLTAEMPGLRGFSARNLRNMRIFYEEWSALEGNAANDNLAVTTAKIDDTILDEDFWQLQLPKEHEFPIDEFMSIGFTQHIYILTKVKTYEERIFYIKLCATEHYTVERTKSLRDGLPRLRRSVFLC